MTVGRIDSRLDGESVVLIGVLPSKKNRVALVSVESGDRRILAVSKEHPNPEAAVAESGRLAALLAEGIPVPAPYGCLGPMLYLEYIEGDLLVDIVEQGGSQPEGWCRSLARWFRRIHEAEGPGGRRLKGDVNLRNFILDPRGSIWGLDFEETLHGDPAVDIGRTLAFILSTRPHFAPGRREICSLILAEYGTEGLAGDPWEACWRELRAMAKRRPAERAVIAVSAGSARRKADLNMARLPGPCATLHSHAATASL